MDSEFRSALNTLLHQNAAMVHRNLPGRDSWKMRKLVVSTARLSSIGKVLAFRSLPGSADAGLSDHDGRKSKKPFLMCCPEIERACLPKPAALENGSSRIMVSPKRVTGQFGISRPREEVPLEKIAPQADHLVPFRCSLDAFSHDRQLQAFA